MAVTLDDVRRQCLALPGVSERQSWGQPAWFARTLMARLWEDGVLTVKTPERPALLASDPATFFVTPHHAPHEQLVLVRMERVDAAELTELLDDAWRLSAPAKLVRDKDSESAP